MKQRLNRLLSIFLSLLIIVALFPTHALAASTPSDCKFILKVSSASDTTPGDIVSVAKGEKFFVDVYISNAVTPTDTDGFVYGLYAVSYDAGKFSIGTTSGTDYIMGNDAVSGWSVFDIGDTENGASSFIQAKVGDASYGDIRLTTVGTTEYHMLRYVFTALATTAVDTYDFSFLPSIGGPTGQLYTQIGTYNFNMFAIDATHGATTFAATAVNAKVTVTEATYTVTYNSNGSTSGNVPTDGASPYLAGATVTVLGNTETPALAKTGCTFAGWNTAADGSGTAYAAGSTFTMGSAAVTLYAQWTALPTYAVTYNGNGSTSGNVPTDSSSPYLAGANVTVLGNTGTLARPGYSFAGWNTAADGSGTAYAAGSTFTMGSAAVTLYAQWTALPTYAVTYNGNGSTSGNVPTDSSSPYLAGANVTVLGNTGTLARPGYSFAGWNTAADGSGTAYAAGATFPMGAAAVTLYAQWTALPTYAVTYNSNGSTSGNVPTDGASPYLAGATVTVLGNTETPALAKTGCTFAGWNTAADGSGTAYAAGSTFTMGSAAVTLYAQWTALPTYAVTYNGNGSTSGTIPTDIASPYLVGATVTVLGNTGTLARTGYTFAGWNTAANGSGTSYAAGATFPMGTAAVTLYAQWMATSPGGGGGGGSVSTKYTVTYDGNTNTSGTVPKSESYDSNVTVTVSDNTGSLTKDGYKFTGWNTKADGSGTFYAAGKTFVVGSSNIILYAVWSSSISYNNEDWASAGQNNYIIAFDKATGKILPMSLYDEKAGCVVYKTKNSSQFQAKYNFINLSDINEDYWASEYIWFMASRDIINGMGDGTYRPGNNVTRAQFVKILASMVDGIDVSAYSSTGFSDVISGQWYENYVNWAVTCGIVEGYGNGCFGPNDELTREQMCCIIERFITYLNYNLQTSSGINPYADQSSINNWASEAVKKLQGSGLINGKTNNMFDPQGRTTRAEAATIVCRLLRAMMSNMEISGKIEWIS